MSTCASRPELLRHKSNATKMSCMCSRKKSVEFATPATTNPATRQANTRKWSANSTPTSRSRSIRTQNWRRQLLDTCRRRPWWRKPSQCLITKARKSTILCRKRSRTRRFTSRQSRIYKYSYSPIKINRPRPKDHQTMTPPCVSSQKEVMKTLSSLLVNLNRPTPNSMRNSCKFPSSTPTSKANSNPK